MDYQDRLSYLIIMQVFIEQMDSGLQFYEYYLIYLEYLASL